MSRLRYVRVHHTYVAQTQVFMDHRHLEQWHTAQRKLHQYCFMHPQLQMNESGIFATVSIQVLEASSAWPLPEIVTCVVVCFVNASSYHAALLEPHSPFPEKNHCGRFTGYAHWRGNSLHMEIVSIGLALPVYVSQSFSCPEHQIPCPVWRPCRVSAAPDSDQLYKLRANSRPITRTKKCRPCS